MQSNLFSTLTTLASMQVLVFLGCVIAALGVYGSGSLVLGIFYVLLALFSTLVSYRLVLVRPLKEAALLEAGLPHIDAEAPVPHPDIFVEQVVVDKRPLIDLGASGIPANLPTVGYENVSAATATTEAVQDDAELARLLEAQAHQAHVLLSTDALRHFMATIPTGTKADELMASVLKTARSRFPTEDGWVVISEGRMRDVCVSCLAVGVASSNTEPYVPTVIPEGTGSLAEMVALGNLGAAFSLIGHRPMFALADAVADFDALYRGRRGDTSVSVSKLLQESTSTLDNEKVKVIIAALTSALDGTYTDEAEAVKTAIMKAVKARG